MVRKQLDSQLAKPVIDLTIKDVKFEYDGDVLDQETVLRWAVHTVTCHHDTIHDISEAQLSVLKRHFPSFAVIYKYQRTAGQLEKQLSAAAGGNICSRTGHTLVFMCHGDLAPLNLYLPLDKSPALVLYAHNIPLGHILNVGSYLIYCSRDAQTINNFY